jgi:ABC-2 type transport system permease protein
MTRAFVYLTVCGLVNRARVRVRRLREPRYLAGLTVGVLYFYFVLFGRSGGSHGQVSAAGVRALAGIAAPLVAMASVVLFVIVAIAWVWPSSSRAIAFTRAEVQFLFPAPLTRRQLLHYKLIRSQTASLLGSLLLSVFFRPGTLMSAWTVITGIWLLFGILNLHFTGVSLARESLTEHGVSGLRRQWLPIAVIVAAVVAIAIALVRDGPRLTSLATGRQVLTELGRVLTTGAAGWALWPTRAIVRLPLATSTAEYWRALPAALGLLVLNYVWVMRSDAAFEEASAEQSEKIVRGRLAPRPARVTAVSTPFSLAPRGRAETAILWKNLILLGRYASLRTLWRLVPLVIVFAAVVSGSHRTGLISMLSLLALGGVGLVVLLGPQILRNDLRQDLGHITLLKTWPVRSAALIRGEVLAPAAVLTGLAWIFVMASVLLVTKVPSNAAGLTRVVLNRVSFGIAALLIAPPIVVVQLIVQNGLAVLFPAWAVIGATRSRGVEVMGQRLLMQAGIWLTLLISIVPAVLMAGVLGFVIYLATGLVPIVAPAALGSAVMLAEAFLATEALGRALDRTDVGSLEPTD